MPVIGFLSSVSPNARGLAIFHRALQESGFVVGRNVAIEYRYADGDYDRLPPLAAELVRRQVSVLVAIGGIVTAQAAKAATPTIPIVFSGGADPVKLGFVASINRPGGNMTGVYIFDATMEAKRLGILRELVPSASLIGVLVNPSNPNAETAMNDVEGGARAVGQQIHILKASNEREIDTAFASLVQLRADALLITGDPFFTSRRVQLAILAARHSIPTIDARRDFVEAGGLASYGIDNQESWLWQGRYTGRILKGEKPADLPVFQSTKFEFLINLKTAKTFGVEVPPMLSARADEVIE
jgi:putative ABC transport system substrate-binding protein